MPELLSRLHAAVDELELAVAAAELALRRRDDDAFDAALGDQRRLHHELALLGAEIDDAAALDTARRRIDAVVSFREAQIHRLTVYRAAVAKRLSTIGKWNRYAKGSGAGDAPNPSLIDSAR